MQHIGKRSACDGGTVAHTNAHFIKDYIRCNVYAAGITRRGLSVAKRWEGVQLQDAHWTQHGVKKNRLEDYCKEAMHTFINAANT